MLDYLFVNATLVDGTGSLPYKGDLGVKDGRIVLGGVLVNENAQHIIDASGFHLCPGFIDAHSHGDQVLGAEDAISGLCKISQGVTTEVTGQCGISPFPSRREHVEALRGVIKSFTVDSLYNRLEEFTDFKSFQAFARDLPKLGNYAFNLGHASLRAAVMGMASRAPSKDEMEHMKAYVAEAMENGCFGLSSGLIYAPSLYASTGELTELCKVLKPYGGIYATHMRSEADGVVEAVKEAIAIAEAAAVPLVISHHKICGKANWGASKTTLALIGEAVDRGVGITMDQYPYEATQTYFSGSIPPRYFTKGMDAFVSYLKDPAERARIKAEMLETPPAYNSLHYNSGGFSGMFIASSPNVPEARGLTVEQYAKRLGKDPFDTYFDLLAANRGGGLGAYFCLDKGELDAIYLNENTVVGSDGIVNSTEDPVHPRAFGTFVKALTLFWRDKGLVSFEKAIYKQTGLPAKRWGLKGKGQIAGGYDADLVLLNRDGLKDRATYADPRQLCEGIVLVMVNGVPVYEGGRLTGAHPGRVLLRN